MILVDTNLLVYAHVSSFAQHRQAHDWLDAQLSGGTPVGLPWPSLLGFLRIVTNPRVFQRPEPIATFDWIMFQPAPRGSLSGWRKISSRCF